MFINQKLNKALMASQQKIKRLEFISNATTDVSKKTMVSFDSKMQKSFAPSSPVKKVMPVSGFKKVQDETMIENFSIMMTNLKREEDHNNNEVDNDFSMFLKDEYRDDGEGKTK